MNEVALGEVIRPAGRRAGVDVDLPVYSVTKHSGFVPSLEYFKKQVFSRDVAGYKLVEPGQFAYATIHLDEGSIGIAPERGLISPMYTVFTVDTSRVAPAYLIRFLKSPRALAHYPRIGRGAVHRRKSISLAALGTIPVPLPPFNEQRRIARILDQADALRAKRRQALTQLDNLTQYIFSDMFGSPETWHERWPMGTIGEMAETVQYGTSSKAGTEGDWPILRMGNVTDSGRLDLSDLKYIDLAPDEVSKYIVRRGDLLFNRTNSKEKVGKAAVVATDRALVIAGYLVRVRMKPQHRSEFVCAYLISRHGLKVRQGMAKAAVNQANISASEMRRIRIATPETSLQVLFADRVSAVEERREAMLNDLAALHDLFRSLQSRAFSGQL